MEIQDSHAPFIRASRAVNTIYFHIQTVNQTVQDHLKYIIQILKSSLVVAHVELSVFLLDVVSQSCLQSKMPSKSATGTVAHLRHKEKWKTLRKRKRRNRRNQNKTAFQYNSRSDEFDFLNHHQLG